MRRILILGAGKIGSLIAVLLANVQGYEVTIADRSRDHHDLQSLKAQGLPIRILSLDVSDRAALIECIQSEGFQALVSALPFHLNHHILEAALATGVHYFDLTEDRAHTEQVMRMASGQSQAFVPQCGLAPGMIGIAAHELASSFERLDSILLRVGALPRDTDHPLGYALTWSTEGLIHEYLMPSCAIEHGQKKECASLEGLEHLRLEGRVYEAFHTSGGLGMLSEIYEGRVNTLNYKTLRYPGHAEKFKFLLDGLKLRNSPSILKDILEQALPRTASDVVVFYVAVSGWQGRDYWQRQYVRHYYPKEVLGVSYAAIQMTTATGLCAMLHEVLSDPDRFSGYVGHQALSFQSLLQGPFGSYYQQTGESHGY